MAGLLNKMSGIFFREEEIEDDYSEQTEKSLPAAQPVVMPNERPMWSERSDKDVKKAERKTNIFSVPSSHGKTMDIVLTKATTYDDLQEIASNIKSRRVVVVNFEEMDQLTAQRMVDFLSGAVYALDGQPKKVSSGTFLFSSSQVDLFGQIMDGDADGQSFPWDRR